LPDSTAGPAAQSDSVAPVTEPATAIAALTQSATEQPRATEHPPGDDALPARTDDPAPPPVDDTPPALVNDPLSTPADDPPSARATDTPAQPANGSPTELVTAQPSAPASDSRANEQTAVASAVVAPEAAEIDHVASAKPQELARLPSNVDQSLHDEAVPLPPRPPALRGEATQKGAARSRAHAREHRPLLGRRVNHPARPVPSNPLAALLASGKPDPNANPVVTVPVNTSPTSLANPANNRLNPPVP
jgi:hypothetical protein